MTADTKNITQAETPLTPSSYLLSRDNPYVLAEDPEIFIETDTGKKDKETGKPIVSSKIHYAIFTDRINSVFHPVTFNRTLYTYDENTGLYEEDTGYLEGWIQNALNFIADTTCKIKPGSPLSGIIKELSTQVMRYDVKSGTHSPFNQYPGIPLKNGVLCIDDEGNITLKQYSPSMMFTRQIPVKYNPEAPTERIKEILTSWLDNHEILIQIPAQALYQSLPGKTPLKAAYLLVGEANAGKSSYINLLKTMFGPENISGIHLERLGERFCLSDMVGKFLNVGDDLPDITLSTHQTFKDITGARLHSVEPKHKASYIADITAVHVYAANNPPAISEKISADLAFWERWNLLKFENTFEKVGGWEEKNFTDENKSGFLNLIINSLKEILKSEKVQYEQELDEVRELWKYAANPLHEFIEDEIERDVSGNILKNEFFESLMKWVNEIPDKTEQEQTLRRLPKTITDLTRKLVSEGIETRRVGPKNNRVWVYSGIRWKANSRFNTVKTVNSHLS